MGCDGGVNQGTREEHRADRSRPKGAASYRSNNCSDEQYNARGGEASK